MNASLLLFIVIIFIGIYLATLIIRKGMIAHMNSPQYDIGDIKSEGNIKKIDEKELDLFIEDTTKKISYLLKKIIVLAVKYGIIPLAILLGLVYVSFEILFYDQLKDMSILHERINSALGYGIVCSVSILTLSIFVSIIYGAIMSERVTRIKLSGYKVEGTFDIKKEQIRLLIITGVVIASILLLNKLLDVFGFFFPVLLFVLLIILFFYIKNNVLRFLIVIGEFYVVALILAIASGGLAHGRPFRPRRWFSWKSREAEIMRGKQWK